VSEKAEGQESDDTHNQYSTISDPRDPFESLNRVSWDFNYQVLDKYLLRPATVAYVTVMPNFARQGLLNAAENLSEPGNVFNNLLQGKVGESLDSLMRFTLNSTVGVLGLIDVATMVGIESKEEEFGEVLGVWGVDTGPYLMIPAYGPNDPRSLTGDVVDNIYYPFTILTSNVTIVRGIIKVLEARAQALDQEKLLENAIDDYAFVKNAYFDNLRYKVTDGASIDEAPNEEQEQNFDEFESFMDDFDMDAAIAEPEEKPVTKDSTETQGDGTTDPVKIDNNN
jgi:phospholipid-binding lipoprotein MlaA